MIGQNEAVDAVADAVLRGRAGLKDPQRPIGSFIFLGPTGVGKTELARALAFNLFDDEHAMIRIDMSEYMEKHTVSRLIGAPPGYVGYEEGGQLTEAVRRQALQRDPVRRNRKGAPGRVQRAAADPRRRPRDRFAWPYGQFQEHHHHHDLQHRLTAHRGGGRTATTKRSRNTVLGELKNYFRPEFLNRVDEIVVFHGLTQENLLSIVDIQLGRFAALLEQKSISFSSDTAAKKLLTATGYDPVYGARPLKRAIQRLLETPISRMLVAGELKEGQTIKVSASGEELKFSVKNKS